VIAHDEIQIRGCSSESRFKRYESKIERAYEQGNTLKKEKFNQLKKAVGGVVFAADLSHTFCTKRKGCRGGNHIMYRRKDMSYN
jgi:hypothetical protein